MLGVNLCLGFVCLALIWDVGRNTSLLFILISLEYTCVFGFVNCFNVARWMCRCGSFGWVLHGLGCLGLVWTDRVGLIVGFM